MTQAISSLICRSAVLAVDLLCVLRCCHVLKDRECDGTSLSTNQKTHMESCMVLSFFGNPACQATYGGT